MSDSKELTISTGAIVGISATLLLVIGIGMVGWPVYSVWRAQKTGEAELARAGQNRQIAIAQARAKAESAHFEADAEVTRAVGVAKANEIIGKPYRYGGGHRRVNDSGYDCSGTVSYALIGAGLQESPLDSGKFMNWGERGKGDWITVFTNPGHAYVVIAGLRLDTSAAGDPGGKKGPRWRPLLRATKGFTVRHPADL